MADYFSPQSFESNHGNGIIQMLNSSLSSIFCKFFKHFNKTRQKVHKFLPDKYSKKSKCAGSLVSQYEQFEAKNKYL